MPVRGRGRSRSAPGSNPWNNGGMNWDQIEPAPLLLIKSGEPVFADRAIDRLKSMLIASDPQTEITLLDAAQYQPHQLEVLTTPSLFGEARAIIVPNLEALNPSLQDELLSYIQMPELDVCVILRHNGGVRGKKLLDALAKAKVPTATIEPVKNAKAKAQAVTDDVRRAGRKMTSDAVGSLVDALGSDLRELLSAVRQLLADVEGTIDDSHVHTYFSGRIEATGFNVADALVAGNTGRAIELARHAVATGTSPVAIVSAIAMKLRTMAQVLGMRSSKVDVKVSMAPWQMDRAKRDLRAWSADGLANAIRVIARADAEVKGESRDAGFALERGILEIGRARKKRNSDPVKK